MSINVIHIYRVNTVALISEGRHCNKMQSWLSLLLLVAMLLLAQGCTSIPPRNPMPAELGEHAEIPGIPLARDWGDSVSSQMDEWFDLSEEEIKKQYAGIYGKKHNYLAISGGGQDGAFGAGLLAGWSEQGTRPEFTMVTGVSTGALTAPFAYLGSAYDAQLKKAYTEYSTIDLITERSTLAAFTGDARADTSKLRVMIAKFINDDLIKAIAVEHRKGRALLIGTTNLDAGRPVIWNIGRIAASGDAKANDLIRDILLASASIPVAFPPVMIEAEANGKLYDEMHVDGGAASQVFLYPLGIDWARVEDKLAVIGSPNVYMIRNSQLDSKWKTITRKLAPIAMRSVDSLIRTQGLGDMYRIYLGSMRDGLEYHLAYIPDDFNEESEEFFDPVYMRKLFDHGYNKAKQGYPWKRKPPGMESIKQILSAH